MGRGLDATAGGRVGLPYDAMRWKNSSGGSCRTLRQAQARLAPLKSSRPAVIGRGSSFQAGRTEQRQGVIQPKPNTARCTGSAE